jgi:hypothetical protein
MLVGGGVLMAVSYELRKRIDSIEVTINETNPDSPILAILDALRDVAVALDKLETATKNKG